MALMVQLRAAYFLTAIFVAISLTGFFLYTQDIHARDNDLDHLLQWRVRLQHLETANVHRSALGTRSSPDVVTYIQEAAYVVNRNQIPGDRDIYHPANTVLRERRAWAQSEDTAHRYVEGSDSVDTADSAKSADVFGDKGRMLLSVHNEKESEQATVETKGYGRYHSADNYYSNDNTAHHKQNYFRYIGKRGKIIFLSSNSSSKHNFTEHHIPLCSRDIVRHPRNNINDYAEEVNAVFKNLETCLASANLTNYFSDKTIRLTAMTNAANLLYMLRLALPTKPIGRSDIPCWEGKLEMQLCQTTQGIMVEGSVHNVSFLTPLQYFHEETKWALKNVFGSSIKSPNICLPKVFIAGFPKCGSSYLYCLVTKLAGMARHTYEVGELEKEPHFWVSRGPSKNHLYPPQMFDLASYLFNFVPAAKSQSAGHYSLPIDGSPNLLFQWPRYSGFEELENYCLIPAVLPHILPHSKYIVTMRNPADMLYSAFWFSCSTFDVRLTKKQLLDGPHLFHEKVMQKIKIFQKCSHSNPLEKCMVDLYPQTGRMFEVSRIQCGRVRLEMGFYYLYIRRWLSIIPREQFLFLTAEELHSNVEKVANDISNFLDLGVHTNSSTLFNMTTSPGKKYKSNLYCGNKQSRYDYHHNQSLQMLDETRNILNDFFELYNKNLADLLGDKKFLWQS